MKTILRDFRVISKILNQKTVRLYHEPKTKRFSAASSIKGMGNSFVDIIFLLQFCLSDLNGNSYAEMDNIKLLPLQDGTLGVISRRTAVKIDQGAVKQLTSMGFPYSIVWVALNKHNNDVVASSTWLLQMQQCQDNENSRKSIFPDEVWDVVPYYVCSDIERELLVGQVQRAMVNIEICPTHVKQILRSKSFQEKVNVNVMTPQVMSYLIVDTLPHVANLLCGLESSEYNDESSIHTPTTKWITCLWKYLTMHTSQI